MLTVSRPVEYLITYKNKGLHVLPKKHSLSRRRKSIPVPCELVELLKDNFSSDLIPEAIKLVYLFKVPRPTVELALEYFKILIMADCTDKERIMTSLLVAHKVNHDLVIKNSMWAKYCGVKTARLTEIERYLLKKLNFSVYLTGV
eukprot:NODE_969_length_2691_cov_0.184028.p1 type:complete len:145 gc:universal NODE_969_length_2691_cov_0.184028:1701-2135(+)